MRIALVLLVVVATAQSNILASGASTTAPATTQSSDPSPERPKIYRMRAGVPGPDGWCVAKSTGGNFAVSLPARFNDVTIGRREDDGTVLRTHMVAATMPDGSRFAASASTNAAVKLPGYAAARYVDMLARQGTAGDRRAVTMDGIEGTEIEVVGAAGVSRYRVVQHGDTMYVLTFQRGGHELPDEAAQMAKKFFESFRFPTAGAEQAPGRHTSTGEG
jgi:hypothetical protein